MSNEDKTTAPDNSTAVGGRGLSEGLGVDPTRAEFEAWAFVRDFDVTHSKLNPLKYANERTQGAWQVWGHGVSNWRDQRDIAVRLLRECETTLAMWADVAPAVSLRADLRRALGMADECAHRDDPRGCYRVRCQLGRKCVGA